MSTENEVINEWRERRDMTVAVKERVERQLLELHTTAGPEDGREAEQVQRIEDLTFELNQLEDACDEAELNYLAHSADANPTTGGEEDNG